jgi:itaconyl-CoA hydratase
LGWSDIELPAPVYAGDTLYASSQVLAKRESNSRPTQGIVTVRTLGKNQSEAVVISYERTILVPKRGYAVDDGA